MERHPANNRQDDDSYQKIEVDVRQFKVLTHENDRAHVDNECEEDGAPHGQCFALPWIAEFGDDVQKLKENQARKRDCHNIHKSIIEVYNRHIHDNTCLINRFESPDQESLEIQGAPVLQRTIQSGEFQHFFTV